MIEVVCHHDPEVLFDELVSRIDSERQDAPLARLLVVAPSERLIRFLQERLAGRLGALLAVDFYHHRSLVEQLLSEHHRSLKPFHPSVLNSLLATSLPEDLPFRGYFERFAGAMNGLGETVRDLRDAGLTGGELSVSKEPNPQKAQENGLHAEVAYRALGEVEGRLISSAKKGWSDDAYRARVVRPWASRFGATYQHVFHYGAYDLIGIHRDLIHALAKKSFLTVMAPGHPKAEAYRRARIELRAAFPKPSLDWLKETANQRLGPFARAAEHLSASPSLLSTPSKPEGFEVFEAPGPRAELTHACRLVSDWVSRDGVRLDEIAILARSLERYEPYLRAVFDEQRIPFRTSAKESLARRTLPRAFLTLLQVISEDLPRQSVIDWLRTSLGFRFGWTRGPRDRAARYADDLSRRHGILTGATSWARAAQEDYDHGSERRRSQAERFLPFLDALFAERDAWKSCATAADHERFLKGLARRWLHDVDSEDGRRVRTLLSDFGSMVSLEGLATRSWEPAEVARWLEGACEKTSVRLSDGADSGLYVLDVMQSRGLFFRRVVLIGLNEGVFPRRGREDPLLGDARRRALEEACGRPIPRKAGNEDEEELLLALALSTARERVVLGYQRSDERDGTQSPSSFFRHVAAVVHGKAKASLILDQADSLPGHPASNLHDAAKRFGRLTPREIALSIGFGAQSPALALDALRGPLELTDVDRAAISFVDSTESFDPSELSFDASFGRDLLPPTLSPTSLERLGRCPLQFYFHDLLKVREPRDLPERSRLSALEVGSEVHRMLAEVYADLSNRGSFDADEKRLLEEGARLLEQELPRTESRIEKRISPSVRAVFDALWERWERAIRSFVAQDLTQLAAQGAKPAGLEREVRSEVTLGETKVSLEGRLDRVLTLRDGGLLVGDYKTGGNIERRTQRLQALRAHHLQLPIYVLMAEGVFEDAVDAEVLGIGPSFPSNELASHRLDPALLSKSRTAFLATIKTLVQLLREGTFPFNSTATHRCQYCAYKRACRRNHPPTEERVRGTRNHDEYFALETKSDRGGSR